MSSRRIGEPDRKVRLTVDGEVVEAAEGEPVAVALAAAGRAVLGRSVKYHRPRGAACYRGRCAGCLMRVDGVGNVMTCRTPARQGMVVETQNVLGTAETDLLSVTDWFFPDGMDHHRMFTRFGSLNRVMQKVARRVAGVGRLPLEVARSVAPRDASARLLVLGGGLGGLEVAAACAAAGVDVALVEEQEQLGGDLALFPGEVTLDGQRVAAAELAERAAARAREAGARLTAGCAAVGIYDGLVVLRDAAGGLVRLRPERLVVATGTHEGPLAVAGNDLPGVMGPRAAATLLSHGVLPGRRIAFAGAGRWVDALAATCGAAGAEVVGPFAPDSLRRVRGRRSVSSVDVVADGAEARHACDALVLSAPPSAAYELAAQAGARVVFEGGAFEVVVGDDGATGAGGVWALGSCTGARSVDDTTRAAVAVARGVIASLAGAGPGRSGARP